MMGLLRVVTNFVFFLTLIPSDIALLTPISKCISLSKVHIEKNKIIQKVAAFSAGLICLCGLPDFAVADMESQLKMIQDVKVQNQKRRIEADESDLQSKELLYPEGKLIGRGIVKLVPERDGKLFPYGLTDPVVFDENLSDKRSSLFVLAVGRDGLPVAAKRLLLRDLTFPYAFEINDDDLVFPYTKEAYLQSEKRLDSVALTVIISPDGLLASTEAVQERIGFALSEPIRIAGSFGRTTANIDVKGKIYTKLYSESERGLLSQMDNQLDKMSLAKLGPQPELKLGGDNVIIGPGVFVDPSSVPKGSLLVPM